MPVDSTHKAFTTARASWQKVRDFVAGGALVKPYVRKLPGHSAETLAQFKDRAYYLPAIARSLDAFTGMIMNPEPLIMAPDGMSPYLDDVSYDGEPASRMIGRTVREVCEVGRCAILVDYPQAASGAQMTVAEAEAAGLRAYARFYRAEDVLDWRVASRGGERYLSFLKLQETWEAPGPDEWTVTEEVQLRVLDFNEQGQYRQRVFRKVDVTKDGKVTGSNWFQYGADIVPMANGQALTEIPAVVFNPDSLDASQIDTPPIMEMVEIADAHLQVSALRQWALLWVGNPTPVFIGLNMPEGQTVAIGSSTGIVLSDGGDAKFLSLASDDLGALKESMDEMRADMAAVGARLLQDETSSQIARDTAIIQRAGEHSVLAQIASTVGDGWKRVLQYLAMWAGQTGDIAVTLNTDFIPQGLTAGELTDLLGAVQAGQLSSRDLFGLLQKRGVVRQDKTFEEHRDEIDEDGALMLNAPPGAAVQPDPANDGDGDNQEGQAA